MDIQAHRTFSQFRDTNCAMLVDVDDGNITVVCGDLDVSIYDGYSCIKGRQLVQAHYSPERLTAWLVKNDSGFVATSLRSAIPVRISSV